MYTYLEHDHPDAFLDYPEEQSANVLRMAREQGMTVKTLPKIGTSSRTSSVPADSVMVGAGSSLIRLTRSAKSMNGNTFALLVAVCICMNVRIAASSMRLILLTDLHNR